mmetsp:Transcript_60178/g.164883  ORF Transcript_60178/g.164883 Transcript_60178/m.164883 type:complete len:149 (-) Transcript_60178:387-833(-)
MPTRAALLWVALLVGAAEAKRSMPAIGDALEYGHGNRDYLKKHTQVVGVMQPLSTGGRRILDKKAGAFFGPNRRAGIVFWSKKRDWKPFRRSNREPFKIRLLKENPTGVMLTLAEEGKLNIERAMTKNGDVGLRVTLAKPKPWYRFGL